MQYGREGRIHPDSDVRCGKGPWQSTGESGVLETAPADHERAHPHRSSGEAISAAISAHGSPHNRLLYLLLGTLLPLFTGIAGVNNLVVGRTGRGLTQIMLSMLNFFMVITGIFIGITLCVAIPLGFGILIWSVIEAATNDRDGEGLLMSFK